MMHILKKLFTRLTDLHKSVPYHALLGYIDPHKFKAYDHTVSLSFAAENRQKLFHVDLPYTVIPAQQTKQGTILCLPGVLGIRPYFYPLIDDRILAHYELIIIDNPGFHITTPSVERVTSCCVAFVDQLGLTDLTIIGNSLGVVVGKNLELHYPERIDQQIWVGCSGLTDYYSLPQPNKRSKFYGVNNSFISQLRLVQTLSYGWSFGIPFSWICYFLYRKFEEKNFIKRLAVLGNSTKKFDLSERLPELHSRICIVHGKQDEIVDVACLQVYQEKLINSAELTIHALDECGHVVLHEQQQQVMNIISEFLQDGLVDRK